MCKDTFIQLTQGISFGTVGGANLVIPKQSWNASQFCMEEFKIWPRPFDTCANGIARVGWLKTSHYLVYIFVVRVANAFESSSTELLLGFSMQKPGLTGVLRMVKLVSEHAKVDHNYLSESSKRACSQAFRGCLYWLPHDQSIPLQLDHLPRQVGGMKLQWSGNGWPDGGL